MEEVDTATFTTLDMNDQDDNDVRFLRQFAAQIGIALREREDAEQNDVSSSRLSSNSGPQQQQRGGNQQPSINESVEDLYHSLCFDEPLIGHIKNLPVVASALSRQLLQTQSSSSSATSCALSNRLVNGVLYLCQQQQQQQQTRTTSTMSLESSSWLNSSSTTSSPTTTTLAISKLAFTILIGVPLECCRGVSSHSHSNSSMDTIRSLLGSYKGTTTTTTSNTMSSVGALEGTITNNNNKELDSPQDERQGRTVHEEQQQQQQQKMDVMNGTHEDSCNSSDESDSDDHKSATLETEAVGLVEEEEEIWAAESDPSDYDFGEGSLLPNGRQQQQHQQHFMMDWPEQEDWLDPKVLSRPDPDLTIEDASISIATLLLLANYTVLEPIFSELSKKEIEQYTSQLTQLTLLLLQPTGPSSSLVGMTIRHSSVDSALLAPLWILRDAATYHTRHDIATTATKISATEQQSLLATCYLEVLQTLLAVDQAYLQDIGGLSGTATSRTTELCVASLVGLSALSSWCAMDRTFNALTVEAVVDCMNDMTHVVERAIAGGTTSKQNLCNALIPIIEIVSDVYYDHVDKARPIQSSIAQTLLNSGFLRQILVLALQVAEASSSSQEQQQQHYPSRQVPFHHALWGLCISYPTIVGKYVFRYPGVTGLVRQYVIQNIDDRNTSTIGADAQDCAQSILWNMYGWSQCDNNSNGNNSTSTTVGPKIVWKQKPSSKLSPATVTGPPLSRDECKEVSHKAWSRLCQLVQKSLQQMSGQNSADQENGDLIEIDTAERVIQEWGRLLVFAKIPIVSANLGIMIDPSLLLDVSKVFSNLPRQEEKVVLDSTASSNPDLTETLKDHDVHEKQVGKTSRRHQVIAHAHKTLKEYQLHFQGTAVNGSSKMD